MSELKALWIPTRSGNSLHCYIKSEADKVIALLTDKANYNEYAYKNKKQELVDTCHFYEEELRHHKYKRCLAMADMCAERRMYWTYRLQDDGDKGYSKDYKFGKNCFWRKWCVRWLKIAEQFKEA